MPSHADDAARCLAEAREDWSVLDRPLEPRPAVHLVSHEPFTPSDVADVEVVQPGPILRALVWVRPLQRFLWAWKLLGRTPKGTVLLLNGGSDLWIWAGLLNRLPWIGGRRVLLWDVFVETDSRWRRRILRAAVRGTSLAVLWSGRQVAGHARFLGLPEGRFLFLPYKANHSMRPPIELALGDYVFAGGNGKRDYATLVEAVRGTGVPVVVSATDHRVRDAIERIPNLIALAAWEPAFAQLQAASRFVVIPMISTGVKGGGEANFCNGMWHGKPVIAADDMAASDYVLDGETGYVVPSGDAKRLRERILELWRDPARCREMGRRSRQRALEHFTQARWLARLLRLALVLGSTERLPE